MADYRYVKCKFWSDTYIENLSGPGKAIYLWGFTNEHTTLSGIYNISEKKISNEVGFDLETVSKFLDKFTKDGKIVYTKDNFIWFKNFLRHQPAIRSETALKRVARELEELRDENLINQFLDEYEWLNIPYKKKKKPKGKKKPTKRGPDSIFTDEENKILKELKEVKDFPYNPEDNIQHIRKLRSDFPDVDALNEIKRKTSWWKDNPIKKNSRPYLQLRNWFEIAHGRIEDQKGQMTVGESSRKSPIPNKDWEKVARHLFDAGKKEKEVSKFYGEAIKTFPKIKSQWEKSDRKPETFIMLINKHRDPF